MLTGWKGGCEAGQSEPSGGVEGRAGPQRSSWGLWFKILTWACPARNARLISSRKHSNTVTLQWRNMGDTTLAKWSKLPPLLCNRASRWEAGHVTGKDVIHFVLFLPKLINLMQKQQTNSKWGTIRGNIWPWLVLWIIFFSFWGLGEYKEIIKTTG